MQIRFINGGEHILCPGGVAYVTLNLPVKWEIDITEVPMAVTAIYSGRRIVIFCIFVCYLSAQVLLQRKCFFGKLQNLELCPDKWGLPTTVRRPLLSFLYEVCELLPPRR